MEKLKKLFNTFMNYIIIKENTEDNKVIKKINYKLIAYITIIMIIILSMFFYLSEEKVKNEIKQSNNKVEYLFYASSFEESIKELKSIQDKDPWPIWIVREAEIYSVKGDYKKSNELLNEAIDKRNEIIKNKKVKIQEDKEFLNRVVFTFLMNGENKYSLELGEEYLSVYSDNKELMRTMIVVYMINDQEEKAVELIKNYPVDKESAYDMAVYSIMQMTLDEWDLGLSILKDAWYLDKDEIKVFDVISQMSLYNYDFLENKINELAKNNSEEVCYKLWQSKIYSMRKEKAKEAQKIIDSLKENDNVGKINYEIIKAKTYQNLGEEDKANDILTGLMELENESYIGYHIASVHYLDSGNYDEALEHCKKSIIKNKNYPDNYGFIIPSIMLKQGKAEEAEPYMRTALLQEPFNYNLMLSVAEYYWYSAKDSKKALTYLNMAAKINSRNEKILYNMAMINISENKLDDAVEKLRQAIKVNEMDSKLYRALGTIYCNINKGKEGLENFKKAYEINNEDALTLNNLGCAYISIDGDIENGMKKLNEAKEKINVIKDEKIREQFNKNYDNVKKLYDEYSKKDGGELKVPDLTLFY